MLWLMYNKSFFLHFYLIFDHMCQVLERKKKDNIFEFTASLLNK